MRVQSMDGEMSLHLWETNGLVQRLLYAGTTAGRVAFGGHAQGIEIAPADFSGIQLERTGAFGVPPLQALVFASNPDWVSDVWVSGHRCVQHGRHAKRDAVREAAMRWLP